MKIRDILKPNRRNKLTINPALLGLVVFIVAMFIYNFQAHKNLVPEHTYYVDTLNSTLPIIYQNRKGRKINEMRGYRSSEYSIVANETLTVLETERKLNLLIKNNGTEFNSLEYEVRDKTSNNLLERTKMDIPEENINRLNDETKLLIVIQNLIKQNTTYLLTIKLNLPTKQIYYFTNIQYNPKNNLDDAISQVEDFTTKTFDTQKAATLVKYLETSINRDTREMYNVTLQQTFEQLTFANTKMKPISEFYYYIHQAQEYSFSIEIDYLTKSGNEEKNEFFVNKDEYVLRWDGTRWYYMKFNRNTEEIINLTDKPFNEENERFYTGITNPNKFVKIESENKKFFTFCKQREIYIYDVENSTMTNVFSYQIKDEETFAKVARDIAIKIMDIKDDGTITYIVYGYNMTGLNEGNMGIGIYVYDIYTNQSEEKLFIPIYTTFQSLNYDINRLCVFKNNRLIFKSYNKVYSIDIDTAEILTLAENFEETKFAASGNNRYFAFNNDKEGKSKHINIYNIEDGKINIIEAKENENIEVVTFMNDDLFYGVFSDENIWREVGKIIGKPSHEIRVINAVTGKEDVFKEKDRYLYNFVNEVNVLGYNKYSRDGTHYTYLSNDVIVNNYSNENNDIFPYKEEFTKEKLRIGYIQIKLEKGQKLKYQKHGGMTRKQIEDTVLESAREIEENIYYVYDGGTLKAKLKNLSDGINEIRDNYGYVKFNDKITCYNRANKGNVSYLRQKNTILENIEGFEENIYLKNNNTLIMNVTGVTERDLEYYMSLNEKIAVFKYDTFQFFITGYDNNNFVLEYSNGDRILTPRDEVKEAVIYGGYVLFAQLENLE